MGRKGFASQKPSPNWVVVGAADDMYMYPQTSEGMSGDRRNKLSSVLDPLKLTSLFRDVSCYSVGFDLGEVARSGAG